MGHEIEYRDYPETVKKKDVEEDLNAYVRQACWREGGGGIGRIRWLDHTCDSYKDAMEYISRVDNGNYDQLAVRYLEKPTLPPTKAMTELNARILAERKKREEYRVAHSVKAFKAEYIGCPKCGSKLKRELLFSDHCPLCRTDMRSKTTLDTLARYDEKIKSLTQRYHEEEVKLAKKPSSQSEVRWLVKFEYHQ